MSLDQHSIFNKVWKLLLTLTTLVIFICSFGSVSAETTTSDETVIGAAHETFTVDEAGVYNATITAEVYDTSASFKTVKVPLDFQNMDPGTYQLDIFVLENKSNFLNRYWVEYYLSDTKNSNMESYGNEPLTNGKLSTTFFYDKKESSELKTNPSSEDEVIPAFETLGGLFKEVPKNPILIVGIAGAVLFIFGAAFLAIFLGQQKYAQVPRREVNRGMGTNQGQPTVTIQAVEPDSSRVRKNDSKSRAKQKKAATKQTLQQISSKKVTAVSAIRTGKASSRESYKPETGIKGLPRILGKRTLPRILK